MDLGASLKVAQYALRRLVMLVPTFWLTLTLLFLLIRVIPGDAVTLLFADSPAAREEYYDIARQELGLSDPIHVQYTKFMSQMLRGDLGTSIWTGKDIRRQFFVERLPVTLELGFAASILGITSGVALGVLSSLKQSSLIDLAVRTIAIVGLSVPGFWLATLLIILPSYWWQWSLPVGYRTFTEAPSAHLQQILLPALVMGLHTSAVLMRYTRSMMLEVVRQDYMRTAYAKGLQTRVVMARHGLRNALIPLVSVAGLQVAALISGTIIFETIFSLPGVGTFIFEGVSRRDYPVVQGAAAMLTVWVLLVNFGVDLVYPLIDPRIRYE
jgi:peptide/nickel transport system permease protein